MSFDSLADSTSIAPGTFVNDSNKDPQVRWSTLDGVVVLIGAFVIYIVGSIAVEIVDRGIEGKHFGFWVIPVSYVFLTLGVFAMAQWWLIGRRRTSWHDIGFRLPPAKSLPGSIGRIVLIAFCAFILVQVGASIITGIFALTGFHIKSNVKELLPQGQSSIDLAQYLVLVVVGAILAPITEETLFRGVLYQGMRRDASRIAGSIGGITIAAIVSGSLFGVFHLIGGSGELHTLPVLIYLGILLAVTFQMARSLGGSMLVHAAVNFASITYLFSQAH